MKWIIESRWVRPGEQDERPIFLLRLGSKFEDKPGVAWTERKEDACQFVDKIIAQVAIDNLLRVRDLPIYPVVFLTEVPTFSQLQSQSGWRDGVPSKSGWYWVQVNGQSPEIGQFEFFDCWEAGIRWDLHLVGREEPLRPEDVAMLKWKGIPDEKQ